MDQRSPEWFSARCGRVTASRVADVIAKTAKGWGASRANYAAQLVCERLTGTVVETFQNEAMRWGTEKEAEARDLYAFRNDVEVAEVGFVIHPKIPMSGASPDGLVSDDGLLEIKCPQSATHIEILQTGSIPSKYLTQMYWQMACTGRQWCDFMSFDPRMPASMQSFEQRVDRDNEVINKLELDVISFIADVSRTVNFLKARYERKTAADDPTVDLMAAG